MSTWTVTITGVFEAATREEALAEFADWLAMPGCIEDGAEVTEEP